MNNFYPLRRGRVSRPAATLHRSFPCHCEACIASRCNPLRHCNISGDSSPTLRMTQFCFLHSKKVLDIFIFLCYNTRAIKKAKYPPHLQRWQRGQYSTFPPGKVCEYADAVAIRIFILATTQNPLPTDRGSFAASLPSANLEIHRVFLRYVAAWPAAKSLTLHLTICFPQLPFVFSRWRCLP